jgi:ketosteroid isomerase-like protein
MGKALAMANRMYEASNRQLAGLPEMAELITDDMTFTGPLNSTSNAEEYLALLGTFLQAHQGYRISRQFEDGDHACSIYDLLLTTPSGETLAVPMVDWIRLRDGKIAEQRLYYDPRAFMAAMGLS